MSNMIGIGLSAAIGGLAAVLADLFQKKDASAIYEFTTMVNQMLGQMSSVSVPVGGVGLGLLVLSVVLAYLQEARTRMAAFYSGASVLTVLMTLMPYNAPMPLPSGSTVNQISSNDGFQLIAPAYAADDGRIVVAQNTPLQVAIIVKLPVDSKRIEKQQIDGIVYDAVSGQKWRLSTVVPKTTDSKDVITYRFDFAIQPGRPVNNKLADLNVRVWARGYQAKSVGQVVTKPGQPVVLEATLQPSALPGALQRALEAPTF